MSAGEIVQKEGQGPRNERRDFHGIPITIEYLKGEIKPGHDPDDDFGFLQNADYGFIIGTTSNEEGEGLDVYIGPEPASKRVFLVALMMPDDPDVFMEYKALLGWNDHKTAERFCKQQYSSNMVGLLFEVSIADLIDMSELQRPMTEKLMIRVDEEAEAEQMKLKERDAHEPELTLIDEEATDARSTVNEAGDSTGFVNEHRHILLADGTTEPTAAPDGPIHTHRWGLDKDFTSKDEGHVHSLSKAREPDLTVN